MVISASDRPADTDPEFRMPPCTNRSVGGWLAWADAAQGGLALDALLFATSSIFAAITVHNRMLPPHGAWGRVAMWGYAAALVVALALLVARRGGAASQFTGTAARATLTAVVFAVTALLPLVVQAVQRTDGRLDRAEGEVLVIEAGGGRL